MTVATHSSTVVAKTSSPVSETAWPSHSLRQLWLARKAETVPEDAMVTHPRQFFHDHGTLSVAATERLP